MLYIPGKKVRRSRHGMPYYDYIRTHHVNCLSGVYNVSPLATLLAATEIFAALALKYFEASSKDNLVLVLFS